MIIIHEWPEKIAKEVESQYKRFLFLKKEYKQIEIPPSREIDEYWHNHILYTEKYNIDCVNYFGEFLHHNPHSIDINFEKLFNDNTQELYLKHFETYLYITYPKLYRRNIMRFLKNLFKKKKATSAICL